MRLESIAKGAQISGIEEGNFVGAPFRSLFTLVFERREHRLHQRIGQGDG